MNRALDIAAAATHAILGAGLVLGVAALTFLGFTPAASAGTYSGVRVYNSTNTAVVNNFCQDLPFNTEDFDTDAFHDTSTNTTRLVAPAAGYYEVGASVDISSGGSRKFVDLDAHKGGSAVTLTRNDLASSGSGELSISPVATTQLGAGDYVTVCAWQNSGGTVQVGGASSTNEAPQSFWMNRLDAAAGGGGSSTLAGLTDVNVATPTNGQALTYDSSTSKWKNTAPASGGSATLASLTDVDTTGKVLGSVLKYDPTVAKWIVGTDSTGTGGGGTGLSADDSNRLDLVWIGVWALVGLLLVGLVAQRFFSAFGLRGKLG